MRWHICFFLLPSLVTVHALAAPVARDDATNPAYAAESGGAWKGLLPSANENPPGSDNGGYGFLPWDFQGGFHDPNFSPYGNLNHFIDGVDFAHSSFNDLGSPAFGLTNSNIAHFGFTSRATRVFSQPLAVSGSFSIEFDNPLLAPLKNNDETGYIIRFNSGAGAKLPSNPNVHERLGFFAFDGFNSGHWNRADGAGSIDTGLATSATTSGAMLRLTLQTAETYLLQILPVSGGSPLYSVSGNLASTGLGSIDTIEVVMFGNGSGNGLTGTAGQPTGQREFFFDSLMLDNPQTFLTGDYNRDGKVDTADYVIWRDTFNQSIANGSAADANWDGLITQADYDLWRGNFGASSATGQTGNDSQVQNVPETTGLVWIVLLICANRWRPHTVL
jgi:hypothetical protein